MARKRCFEVIKMKITFYCSKDESGKTTLVTEVMGKYLKRYTLNTKCKVFHQLCDVETPDVMVDVEFSKPISLNTAEKILIHIVDEKSIYLTYTKSSKELKVSITG